MIKILSKACDVMDNIDEECLLYMTHASILSLYTKYVNECDKYSPPLDNLDQNMEVLVDQIKKSKIPLRELSRPALERIVITLLNKEKI